MRYFILAASLLLFCVFISNSASAHWYTPEDYAVTKLSTLRDKDGRVYILERLETSFLTHPYFTQIRNDKGFVVARVLGGKPFFCPSLDWCWVLSYYPRRFDAEAIRNSYKFYEKLNSRFEGGEKKWHDTSFKQDEFLDYLNKLEYTKFESSKLLYPRHIEGSDNRTPFRYKHFVSNVMVDRNTMFGAYYEYPYYLPVLVLMSFYLNLTLSPHLYMWVLAAVLCHIPFIYLCKKRPYIKAENSISVRVIGSFVWLLSCIIIFFPYLFLIFLWPMIMVLSGRIEFSILLYWLLFGLSLYLIQKIKKMINERASKK